MTTMRFEDEPALSAELEVCTVDSWPAREVLELDGWLLRFTRGFTHRANSVATSRFTGGDPDARIDAVEIEYRRRGLAPMFQVTPATAPASLQARLGLRGYRDRARSSVCIAPVQALALPPDGPSAGGVAAEVRLRPSPDDDFERLILATSKSDDDGRERLDILGRIREPLACVVVRAGDVDVAAGTGVLSKPWVGINMMRTQAAHRRRGYARRVLAAIAGWAAAQGASAAYLGVECDNAPARSLYAKAGFTPLYDYQYWVTS
jgi:GNAT superfamily N-acetyltransferase